MTKNDDPGYDTDDKHYKKALYRTQLELVKLQRYLIKEGGRVLVILEGRDGAGKDGASSVLPNI